MGREGGRRRPLLIAAAAVVAVVAVLVGVGLYWFEPWKLWQEQAVSEVLPSAAPSARPSDSAGPAAPRTLATGDLISHEHTTTGKVKIIQLRDGSRFLRLEGLDTSNGPDLRVC